MDKVVHFPKGEHPIPKHEKAKAAPLSKKVPLPVVTTTLHKPEGEEEDGTGVVGAEWPARREAPLRR